MISCGVFFYTPKQEIVCKRCNLADVSEIQGNTKIAAKRYFSKLKQSVCVCIKMRQTEGWKIFSQTFDVLILQ